MARDEQPPRRSLKAGNDAAVTDDAQVRCEYGRSGEIGCGPQRAAGAYVVLVKGQAALYVEKGGRGLVALRELDGPWEAAAIAALRGLLTEGRFRRIAVEKVDTGMEPFLREAGFVATPKGLVLYS